MSLVIPDAELRTISGEVLSIPALIAALTLQLAQAQQSKDDTEEKDNGNKVFFDFYLSIINAYHAEKPHINSIQHTNYLAQTLDDSARQLPGNKHFPSSPIWVNLIPKLLDENNGNPTSNIALYEQDVLPQITAAIDPIRNGYTDGALTDTAATAPMTGFVEVDVGGFMVGQRIVVDDSGISFIATIDAIDSVPPVTGVERIDYTILAGTEAGIGVGARVRNFHPGWSDAEREETVFVAEPEVLHYFESFIDPLVVDWETTLDGQLAALNTNEAIGSEEAQISTAIQNVTDAKDDIDTWQAAPNTGAGVGRYGDTALAPLEARIATRTTQTAARITEINTALGSVSQMGDGEFSGSGNYHSLFKWIDIRIRKGPGTLFSFYNFDIVFNFIQGQIDLNTDKKAEYDDVLLVTALTEDAVNTMFVTVASVVGLAISDVVKVVSDDDGEPIVTATIVDIQGLVLELDQTVVSALVEQRGRVVKELF